MYCIKNKGNGRFLQKNSLIVQLLKKNSEKLLKCWPIKLFVILENRLHVFKNREGDFCFCLRDFFFSGCTQIFRFTQDDTRGRRCENFK